MSELLVLFQSRFNELFYKRDGKFCVYGVVVGSDLDCVVMKVSPRTIRKPRYALVSV